MYQCDEYQYYIMECINLMENSSDRHRDIADTITKFLKMLVNLCTHISYLTFFYMHQV